MKIRATAIALCLLLPAGLAACSEDSTGDLDKGELTEELENEGLSTEEAECAADALIDADFTRDEVDKLAESNSADVEGVDQDKIDQFTAAITECMGLPDLTGAGE